MSQTVSTDLPSEIAWQQLWFSLRARPWTSLAIIGTERAQLAAEVAQRLATVGTRDEKTPVQVTSALGMSFQDTTVVAATARACEAGDSPLTLLACDSPLENPAMIPVLQAASGVVLVAALGTTRLDVIRRITEMVGRDKLLATVSVG